MKDTIWFVPYTATTDRIVTSCLRSRKKDAIAAFINQAFSGKHDWEYCKKHGWRVIRVRITTSVR